MLTEWLKGLFDTTSTTVISLSAFMICLIASLVLGIVIAASYMFRNKYTKGFLATLALLPAVVCVVIMMVNGNVGIGVAVAGAFSLVRFRSAPGTAKEIGALFLAMSTGLIVGTGYIAYAAIYTVVICIVSMLYSFIAGASASHSSAYKNLRIVGSVKLK